MNKKRNIMIICTVLFVLAFCLPAAASDYGAFSAGQERSFNIDLPHTYQNYYFTTRQKQTNDASGYVRIDTRESNCSGATVWFCEADCSRKSQIVTVTTIGTNYSVSYTQNYNAGSDVRMGTEDYDNTIFGYHNVTGYVNYK